MVSNCTEATVMYSDRLSTWRTRICAEGCYSPRVMMVTVTVSFVSLQNCNMRQQRCNSRTFYHPVI